MFQQIDLYLTLSTKVAHFKIKQSYEFSKYMDNTCSLFFIGHLYFIVFTLYHKGVVSHTTTTQSACLSKSMVHFDTTCTSPTTQLNVFDIAKLVLRNKTPQKNVTLRLECVRKYIHQYRFNSQNIWRGVGVDLCDCSRRTSSSTLTSSSWASLLQSRSLK